MGRVLAAGRKKLDRVGVCEPPVEDGIGDFHLIEEMPIGRSSLCVYELRKLYKQKGRNSRRP